MSTDTDTQVNELPTAACAIDLELDAEMWSWLESGAMYSGTQVPLYLFATLRAYRQRQDG